MDEPTGITLAERLDVWLNGNGMKWHEMAWNGLNVWFGWMIGYFTMSESLKTQTLTRMNSCTDNDSL